MNAKTKRIGLMWYHIRRAKFTGEYGSGVITGTGFGIATIILLMQPQGWLSLLVLLGFAMIFVGNSIAVYLQDQYMAEEQNESKKRE